MCLCHATQMHIHRSTHSVYDRMPSRSWFKTNILKCFELQIIWQHMKYFFSCVLITFGDVVSRNNLSAGYGAWIECLLYGTLVPRFTPPPQTKHGNVRFLYRWNVGDQNNQFRGYRSSLCPEKFNLIH